MSKRVCITNCVLVDRRSPFHLNNVSITFEDGRIVAIGNEVDRDAVIVDLSGDYLSAGWMDLHTHVNPSTAIGLDPDLIGVKQGVSLVVDAGSCGADNIDDFMEITKNSLTKIKLFLNVSRKGLTVLNELVHPEDINNDVNRAVIQKYRDSIVGLKVRASKSVMGDNFDQPFEQARNLADETQLPIMVHIGNTPPELSDVLKYLRSRDIITHCFHGKSSRITNEETTFLEVEKARNKGIRFDIGHGNASYSLDTYQEAIRRGLSFESISSDLHQGSIHEPVHALSEVMGKLVSLNLPFDDVVERVTGVVSDLIKLENMGSIKVGNVADFTHFRLERGLFEAVDSERKPMRMQVKFVPVAHGWTERNIGYEKCLSTTRLTARYQCGG